MIIRNGDAGRESFGGSDDCFAPTDVGENVGKCADCLREIGFGIMVGAYAYEACNRPDGRG